MAIQVGCCTPTVTVFAANSTPKFLFSQNYPTFSCKLKIQTLSKLSINPLHKSPKNGRKIDTHFISKASASSSVGSVEYVEEPSTKVKFPNSVDIPGCSSSLTLLGTGYREKVFAIIGVKVYAAGLYVNPTMLNDLSSWKGKSAAEIEQDLSVFQTIYQSSLENSLQIELVRDVDGKTFWDALDEAVSPRVAAPTPVDDSALSTFRSIFEGRSLKKGTLILLTWLEPSKMLVSVSTAGVPAEVDATINSMNVTRALFDVFFGESPVSPTLKTSVATGLAKKLQ
ncbi:fatty-acid-binding protein 3, chloroplastic [Silene latifolia]|uniref:fatty-acid-binding protein 3, chloroplastic n=1 Tax=Silene latifolia TaxID=37657 RepID=UPI003D785F46